MNTCCKRHKLGLMQFKDDVNGDAPHYITEGVFFHIKKHWLMALNTLLQPYITVL